MARMITDRMVRTQVRMAGMDTAATPRRAPEVATIAVEAAAEAAAEVATEPGRTCTRYLEGACGRPRS